MKGVGSGLGIVGLLLAAACGPSTDDAGGLDPRTCGAQGPIDLADIESVLAMEVERAGEHYLTVTYAADRGRYRTIDRCGEWVVELPPPPPDEVLGVAGQHIVHCDADGRITWVDPTGGRPPHPLFEPVHGCRVLEVAEGLAAQARDGSTVWFVPDPTDPDARPRVLTDRARRAEAYDASCSFRRLDCEPDYPGTPEMRATDDELLVILDDGSLVAFSPNTGRSRALDPGPVAGMALMDDRRHLAVAREFGPDPILDLQDGRAFDSCCTRSLLPPQQLSEWIVVGSLGAPTDPPPLDWVVLRSHHLPSGRDVEVRGTASWTPRARLTSTTLVADIREDGQTESHRYVVGFDGTDRTPLDPDVTSDRLWTVPYRDGAYVWTADGGIVAILPDGTPDPLARGVRIHFATTDGRIVFSREREFPETAPLRVMLPDNRVVELDDRVVGAFGASHWHWPIDADEVLYIAETEGRFRLRRALLP